MKMLVTGYKGYLGNEFVKKYGQKYEIIGFDHKDGDEILDYASLETKMQGCEQVVHLAAIQKPVEGKSFEEYFDNNVRGTLNVIKAAVTSNLKDLFMQAPQPYMVWKEVSHLRLLFEKINSLFLNIFQQINFLVEM